VQAGLERNTLAWGEPVGAVWRLFRDRNSFHTAATELLRAGVDPTVIALWFGHESIRTTQIYLDANLAM
jgi:integrase